jgi:hypothetical protein
MVLLMIVIMLVLMAMGLICSRCVANYKLLLSSMWVRVRVRVRVRVWMIVRMIMWMVVVVFMIMCFGSLFLLLSRGLLFRLLRSRAA